MGRGIAVNNRAEEECCRRSSSRSERACFSRVGPAPAAVRHGWPCWERAFRRGVRALRRYEAGHPDPAPSLIDESESHS